MRFEMVADCSPELHEGLELGAGGPSHPSFDRLARVSVYTAKDVEQILLHQVGASQRLGWSEAVDDLEVTL